VPLGRQDFTIVRATPIVLGFVIALMQGSLVAQQRRAALSQTQQADAELNRTYQQVMKTLSPPAKEQLRKAERAWLDFVVRNRAAFQATASRLGFSASQCEGFEAGEFFDRDRELSAMSSSDQSANEEASPHLARTDEELNVVYQRCLTSVSGADAERLRDAQRAWIAFRDANRSFGAHVLLIITSKRIEQLNDFYIGTPPTAQPPSEPKLEKPDPSVPDPFERAR
jgi:uncharacterized protein YecT (DUF1311 family)